MTENLPAMISVAQAAELLSISRGHAYALAKSGELPGVVRLGRLLRVSRAAIERVLAGDPPPVLPSGNQARVLPRR